MRPVGVVGAEGASRRGVPRVLDGDDVGRHGDDAAAARVPLSLGEGQREVEERVNVQSEGGRRERGLHEATLGRLPDWSTA